MSEQDFKFLEDQRDRYYNGSWSEMLKDLRYRVRNRSASPELRQKQRLDIETIEIHLGKRPVAGFRYLNGHCRIPADLTVEELEEDLSSLALLIEKGKFDDDKEKTSLERALMTVQEVIFMFNNDRSFNRSEGQREPIKYGDFSDK